MKGLIYKDVAIFIKGIDRKSFLIAGGTIVLLMVKAGIYAGLLSSIMLALTISIQNINSFTSDEKVDWKKYQLALPVNAVSVVTSKYISVVCTLMLSLAGSILFNLLSSIAYQSFSGAIWGISAALSVIIPLLWTGITLPLTYWFGFHSAQVMGMLSVFPLVYIIKYFEDGAGFSAMTNSMFSYVAAAGIAASALFLISMIISMIGYNRKR